ncbi:LuxR C-terminal-related transcriptional regulator [Lentzea sp. NPDC058450]|uniref:helix-turn-helix transcriptional regulator n=1 Tax=Lentzea sp. NPDC058450 TaxID=3346505 RepID=UPI00364DEDCE
MLLDEGTIGALERARDAHHVVLTGPAGCGKSAVLASFEGFTAVDDGHAITEAEADRVLASGEPLVIAHRLWPDNRALARLVGSLPGTVARVPLGPLSPSQVRTFAAGVLGEEPSRDLVARLYERTGGTPAFVLAELSADPRAAFARHFEELPATARDLLLAGALGAPFDLGLLASVLAIDLPTVSESVESLRSAGLLKVDGSPLSVAADAIIALTPADVRADLLRKLAVAQAARAQPVSHYVLSLLDLGVADADLAEVFTAAGREVVTGDPALAARLFEVTGATTDLARAHALSGDLDGALEAVHAAADADALLVAATVLTLRGQVGRGAELLQHTDDAVARGFAVTGLLGAGHLDRARSALAARAPQPTGSLSDSLGHRLADIVVASVTGPPMAAVSAAVATAGVNQAGPRAAVHPDSPVALAALICLHAGELATARTLLSRSVLGDDGLGLQADRHRLLLATTEMLAGDLDAAELDPAHREPREDLFATALALGTTRRAGDLRALGEAWEPAQQALVVHPVDLYTLIPLTEIVVAAARIGQFRRVETHLSEAWALLDRLDNPPLWTTLPRWNAFHAALLTGDHDAADEHLAVLTHSAATLPFASALADAGRCWTLAGRNEVDAAEVEAAARELRAHGLRGDAARLAGHAAMHTTDRKAMAQLLDTARQFQGQGQDRVNAASLSDREQEVAALVRDGLTYREVGDTLFISAKTVEHHVTRIRRKLGARNRRELERTLADVDLPATT